MHELGSRKVERGELGNVQWICLLGFSAASGGGFGGYSSMPSVMPSCWGALLYRVGDMLSSSCVGYVSLY